VIRLSRVTLREIHLPLVEPFQTAAGLVEQRRILLLELTDADGAETWSECVAESLPTYLGQPFSSPVAAHVLLERTVRGNRMARASIEMGVWAIAALQRELPLATLLAGESAEADKPGTGPRQSVETGIALGIQSVPSALAERSAAARAAGYTRIKVKIEPGRDIAFVQAAREALGPDFPLSVDANGSYSLDHRDHVHALDTLDKLGLAMIEQPLAHDDLIHHAELQRRLKTAICLDESISSEADVEVMLSLGSARVLNLKPGRVGGFHSAIAIHDRCASAGVPVWCGGMLECGIGRAYNVALASLPNFTLPGDLSPSARYWTRDVVRPPWTMDANGRVRVPLDNHGLGVKIDVGLIDNLTVRRASFEAS
jgi:o-succinylbenzoate synthase